MLLYIQQLGQKHNTLTHLTSPLLALSPHIHWLPDNWEISCPSSGIVYILHRINKSTLSFTAIMSLWSCFVSAPDRWCFRNAWLSFPISTQSRLRYQIHHSSSSRPSTTITAISVWSPLVDRGVCYSFFWPAHVCKRLFSNFTTSYLSLPQDFLK